MNNIFFGFVFVFLDYNLNFGATTVGLIPDFIGYILIAAGLKELTAGGDRFSRMRPYALFMAAYTGALYAMDIFGVSYGLGVIPLLLGLIALFTSLYISYNIVKGIQELEAALEQDLNGRPLYNAWLALAVCKTAVYAFLFFPALALVGIIASLVIGIVFLVMMGRTRNLYYGGGR